MSARRNATTRTQVFVHPAVGEQQVLDRAAELASCLGLPLGDPSDMLGLEHLVLVVHSDRLELLEGAGRRQRPITVDFCGAPGERRIPSRGKRELIARAVGDRARHARVVDATAGLARDAFLLALLGYEVTAVERSPVLAVMLEDAIARAVSSQEPAVAAATARLHAIRADAAGYLSNLPPDARPDVVLLDPMYETAQGSALAKKEMRVLRKLVGDDADAADLLRVARSVARRRVVVKRHRLAPPLADGVSHEIIGSRVRFDVYMIQS